MRYSVWAAVSTQAQATDDKESLTEQIKKCRAIASARGWIETEKPFIVPGESRTRWVNLRDAEIEIPELRRMLESAKVHRFDVLMIYDYNRLRDLLDPVAKTLASYGVQIYSANQPVEPIPAEEFNPYATDSEQMMRGMSQIISRWQIADLRRKYRYGVPARVRKGLYGLKIPYGYRKAPGREGDRNAVPVQDEKQAQAVITIKNLFLSGMPYREIQKHLNEHGHPTATGVPWARTTIRKILANPFYAGKVYFGRVRAVRDPRGNTISIVRNPNPLIMDGKHQPLYSWEEYLAILNEFENRGRFPFTTLYAFSGLLKCSICGGRIRHKRTHWRCLKDHVKLSEIKAMEILPPAIQEALTRADKLPRPRVSMPDHSAQIAEIERAIIKVQRLTEREIYSEDEAEKRIKELKAQAEKILHGEDQQQKEVVSQNAFYATLTNIRELPIAEWIIGDDPETVNPILLRLIRHIEITPTHGVTVELKIGTVRP